MTIPRVTGTGTEPRVSLPRPSGITPRFVSHSIKSHMDSLWERAVLRRGAASMGWSLSREGG